MAQDPAVLSIQSHVVHGYVGNKSAVFPLQVLGLEIDAINTVHFSNHTGYPSFGGTRFSGPDVWSTFDHLDRNGLVAYSHLLTGYIGSAEVLDTVERIVKRLKSDNPSTVYVCDPVLGDNGKLYVPEDLVQLFRDKLIPRADIVLPNQFELEQLTAGGPVESIDAVIERVGQLHARGPSTVLVTSLGPELCPPGEMLVLGSHRPTDGASFVFTLRFPRIPNFYFTGTGDLLAALFLAWSNRHPSEPQRAAQLAIATIQAVIKRTAEACAKAGGESTPRTRELKLIQSKHDIEDPDVSSVTIELNPHM